MRAQPLKRDLYGGALFVLIGTAVLVQGRVYGVGTLTHMGAGFFPVALGILLVALGGFLAIGALLSKSAEPTLLTEEVVGGDVSAREWRGLLAIVGGVLVFIFVGKFFGLAPAALSSVFITALGDKNSTLKGAAVLAVVMTSFAVGFFSFVLNVQFPIFLLPFSR